MKSVCVFCGSRSGNDKQYTGAAYEFGKALAEQNLLLIYGGAKVGMMGAVADGALQNGGKAIGVLPVFFKKKEIAHNKLDELILVDSMHERKVKLIDMSDAFVALPGGFGTLDEISEVLTLSQLGKYTKPMGFLNTGKFFDPLLHFFGHMENESFISPAHLKLFHAEENPAQLINWLRHYEAPEVKRWIK
ncbi:MAG: LOG family protein YvdD [Bacteroidetes bacterium ADurb.Bin408]|nr:MAG: LOG family protein YvdD [Bacteroidetes bacterium ADurb.Bin408]